MVHGKNVMVSGKNVMFCVILEIWKISSAQNVETIIQ